MATEYPDKSKPTPVRSEERDPQESCLTDWLSQPLLLSEQALCILRVYAEVTDLPLSEVANQAVRYWWKESGREAATLHVKKSMYFAENPGASELDFRKYLEKIAQSNHAR